MFFFPWGFSKCKQRIQGPSTPHRQPLEDSVSPTGSFRQSCVTRIFGPIPWDVPSAARGVAELRQPPWPCFRARATRGRGKSGDLSVLKQSWTNCFLCTPDVGVVLLVNCFHSYAITAWLFNTLNPCATW